VKRAALLAAVLALGACGGESPAPAETAASSAPTPAQPAAPPPEAAAPVPALVLPTVDEAAIKAALTADETLEVVSFDAVGSATKEGAVEGYKSKVWAVPLATGQTMIVTFEPSNTNLYMNVADSSDMTGAAVFVGETSGAKAEIVAPKDGVYLVKPFQPRAMARRDEKGRYKLTIERK
jgi:hypothetical protein